MALSNRGSFAYLQNSGLRVSVVVPVFNNAALLPMAIERLTAFLSDTFVDYELIFVDDGSTDESPRLLRKAAQKNEQIRLVYHSSNLGQQQAIADGLFAAQHDVILGIDADLPCEFADLKKLALRAAEGTELVLGRRQRGFHQVWWRRAGSFVGNWIFCRLFAFPIRDFGCSTGAVRRELVERLRKQGKPSRLIKLELLHLAASFTEQEITLPASLGEQKSSYSPLRLAKMLVQLILFRLFRR